MRTLLPLVLVVTGCAVDEPLLGQFGEDEQLLCVVVGEAPADPAVVDDRLTPIVAGPHAAEMAWGDEVAAVTVGVTDRGEAPVELTYEARDDGQELEDAPAGLCEPRIRVAAAVTVTSDDGRLDEAFDADMLLTDDGAWLDAVIDAPSGSVDPVALYDGPDPIDPAAIQIHLSLGGTFSGSISPLRTDDPNEDVRVIGSWPVDGGEEL